MALEYNQYAPTGWTNTQTPQSATVVCGYNQQNQTVETDGTTLTEIPFQAPASWSNSLWTTNEFGIVFTCAVPGIYSIVVAQNLTFQNVAEVENPVIDIIVTIISPTTSEFNQVLVSSVIAPVTTSPINVNATVTGIINADIGSTLIVRLADRSGNIVTSSGYNSLPSPSGFLSWNLIAQGAYGNTGVIVL
jgi:hypothetical protein